MEETTYCLSCFFAQAFQKYAEQAEKDDELRNKLQGLQNLKENLNGNALDDELFFTQPN